MKASLWERQGKSKSSIAISVAIHVVVIAALATITFHYPLAGIFEKPDPVKAVPVRYVTMRPRGTDAGPKSRARTVPSVSIPNARSIPVGIPAPARATAEPLPSATAIGAGGSAAGASRDPGIGVGIRPGIPDGRLATNPLSVPAQPITEGQQAERALAAIYKEYLDSARADMNNPKRAPGDWSWGGKDGDKWGWDANGIHVGGITIPNIVLAALPLNMAPTQSPVDGRVQSFIRQDIDAHARVMSEDEFKQAVRRVRDRVDRERRERMEKQGKKKDPP